MLLCIGDTMSDELYANPVAFARELLVALCFEQYLRFFFLDIEDDADFDAPAILRVPSEVVDEIKKDNPKLLPLLLALQNKAITFEQSRSAVIDVAADLMGVDPTSNDYREMVAEVSVSEFFQDELLEFHSWVGEMDETQDYTMRIPFQEWISAYRVWREALGDHA